MSNCSVYVGRLPPVMTEEYFDDLIKIMGEVGPVVRCDQVADKGLLRYEYADKATAREAIRCLNFRGFYGRVLSVTTADEKTKEPRPKKRLLSVFDDLESVELTWESLAELTPAVRAALFSLIEALLEKEPRRVK